MERSSHPKEEAGTFELARELVDRVGELAHKEVELARLEGRAELHRGRIAGELGGAAALAGIAAMCCGLIAAVLGLSRVMPGWLAALCGVGIFGVAALLLGERTVKAARSARPDVLIHEATETAAMLKSPPIRARPLGEAET